MMYAYIQNNELLFTSPFHDIEMPAGVRTIPFPEYITNPVLYRGGIVQKYNEEIAYKEVLNNIANKQDITTIKIVDLMNFQFGEEEMKYIINKRLYPNGVEDKLTTLLFMMAQGNFSAGQQLGAEMLQEYNKIKSVENIITANKPQ